MRRDACSKAAGRICAHAGRSATLLDRELLEGELLDGKLLDGGRRCGKQNTIAPREEQRLESREAAELSGALSQRTSRKERTVTIIRVGATKKYSDGWEGVFAKRSAGKSAAAAKGDAGNDDAGKGAAESTAKKKPAKSARKKSKKSRCRPIGVYASACIHSPECALPCARRELQRTLPRKLQSEQTPTRHTLKRRLDGTPAPKLPWRQRLSGRRLFSESQARSLSENRHIFRQALPKGGRESISP